MSRWRILTWISLGCTIVDLAALLAHVLSCRTNSPSPARSGSPCNSISIAAGERSSARSRWVALGALVRAAVGEAMARRIP